MEKICWGGGARQEVSNGVCGQPPDTPGDGEDAELGGEGFQEGDRLR